MLSKTTIAVGVALILSASAASAASVYNDPELGYSYGADSRGIDALAQAPAAWRAHQGGVSFLAVYPDGTIVGQDPDPNVRLQLQDDYSFLNN